MFNHTIFFVLLHSSSTFWINIQFFIQKRVNEIRVEMMFFILIYSVLPRSAFSHYIFFISSIAFIINFLLWMFVLILFFFFLYSLLLNVNFEIFIWMYWTENEIIMNNCFKTTNNGKRYGLNNRIKQKWKKMRHFCIIFFAKKKTGKR